MPYWQLYYHIVWATKNREPLLAPCLEPVIHGFLRAKAIWLGATVFALDGTRDHIHLVAAIPPRIAVAKFIGQIKAVASTRYNKMHPDAPFFWQGEYGVFSFDGKRLPNYVAYVRRQKEHHTQNAIIPILERIADGEPRLLREGSELYVVHDDDWWETMREMG